MSLSGWRYCVSMLSLLAISLFALLPTAVGAQIIIDPPPLPPLPPTPIAQAELTAQQIDVTITGPLATVQLTQLFTNRTPQPVEGVYRFPLPADAAIGDFQMTVDGSVLEGEVLQQAAARRAYEAIVRERRDPALLAYIGRDLFQVNLFPIPPGATREIALHYSQLLTAQDGLYRFAYPLGLGYGANAPDATLTITVKLTEQPGLRTIYSPNFAIATERLGDDQATVSYESRERSDFGGDFVLYFGADERAIGVNLLSYQPPGEDGYFVLLAAPSVENATAAVVERDLMMVVDVSGSMQGEKLQQAVAAAHYVVDQLNPGDRFNLIAFSTGVRLWQPALQPVTGSAQTQAHEWLDGLTAAGSTDINRALLTALTQLDQPAVDAARPAYLLFVTDGQPTQGERDRSRILANATAQPLRAALRLFTFGVGYDVNATLLDLLSADLGGRSSYVRPDERIDEEIRHFYRGISTPVLTDVALEITPPTAASPFVVDELYPFPLPDLFAGEQLVVAGRYHATETSDSTTSLLASVTLRGVVNGERVTYHYPGQQLLMQGGEPNLGRLWAARKISALLQQIRRSGPEQELIDAIVALSVQYGIVTPYTSAFVPEPGSSNLAQPLSASDDPFADAQFDVTANHDAATVAKASSMVQQAVGAEAVGMSEAIGQLAAKDVVQERGSAKYVAGRTFMPQHRFATVGNYPLTRWTDTRYNEAMALDTISFGSACYFELAADPLLASWFTVAPELIVVVDDQHALFVTTEQEATQGQICPTIDRIEP